MQIIITKSHLLTNTNTIKIRTISAKINKITNNFIDLFNLLAEKIIPEIKMT
jgi:hypothetical protein